MEKQILFFVRNLLWLSTIMQLTTVSSEENVTASSIKIEEESIVSLYAWTAWGSWSPCSRSCGGGVSVQERKCLPRSRNLVVNDTAPSTRTAARVTRQTANDCLGLRKRYHECNTHACAGGDRDVRLEQCSSYDRRPFRGRYYTWVPYIDGDAPCMLNCRPLGQQFYATLAVVADGAPCTRPGYRAVCVQGLCKVVGREVLAVAGSRDVRCGRRLVSGLFARPRLPLGYSYITTVPKGACRLNVSEIVASDNYIAVENIIIVTDEFCLTEFTFALDVHLFAVNGPLMKANGPQTLALKLTNGSYIMNGEFAVSTPGTYEAAGARFVYTREAGLDSVFALGPTHYDIDIMILYTQPNPSIKYEYFTETLPGEVDVESVTKMNLPEITIPPKHTRRHHGFDSHLQHKRPESAGLTKDVSSESSLENVIGGRKFVWKILSYTQCSRSCGGGIQVGKYRCVEVTSTGDREISPVHCTGSPAVKRRRCGGVPCAPRWRAAPWSACPQCGPATRTRIVGCVQDHSRGITKISDLKCPAPKPSTIDTCNIPDCSLTRRTEAKNPQVITDTFRDGPVYTIAVNTSEDIGPEYSFSAVGSWLYTDWSECVGWCVGGGLQTRAVRCADPSGCVQKSPEVSRTCSPVMSCEPHDGHWFTGEWSQCSSPCGGKQVRGALCIGGSGRHLRDSACKEPKPAVERACGGACPQWYYSDWGQCSGNCSVGVGVQRRTVVCTHASSDSASDRDCAGSPPPAARDCTPCGTHIPPGLTIESQKSVTELSNPTTTQQSVTTSTETKDCEDKLPNCSLAVQARLCHYKYYIQNCCDSCKV